MNQLSDEYIRDLKPETMRYDVSLQSDFVISVLPNGIKTWAFLYEYQGRQRRKTLGVYPDMDREQASRALDNARAMIERLGGDLDAPVEESPGTIAGPADAAVVKTMAEGKRPAVLASGYRQYPRRRRTAPRPWGKYALYAVATVVAVALLIGAAMMLRGGDQSSDPTPARATAPRPAKPAQQAPRKNPFAATSIEDDAVSDDATPAEDAADSDTAPAEDAADRDAAPPTESGSDTGAAPNVTPPEASTTTRAAPPEVEREPTVPAAEPLQAGAARSDETASSAATPRSGPAADDDAAASADTLQSAPAEGTQTGSSPGVLLAEAIPDDATPAPVASARDAVLAGVPGNAAADPDTAPPAATDQTAKLAETVDGDASRVSPPAGATSVGGSVPRAVVTSGVDQLEPIDNLNDSVIESRGRFRSLFYFTELRSFSDGEIVHRWEYNGRLIADVPLRVRKSWRWRTYSSKDLLPGMTGDWAVSVVDARGDVLARTEFSFAD